MGKLTVMGSPLSFDAFCFSPFPSLPVGVDVRLLDASPPLGRLYGVIDWRNQYYSIVREPDLADIPCIAVSLERQPIDMSLVPHYGSPVIIIHRHTSAHGG